MKSSTKTSPSPMDYRHLSADQLRALLLEKDNQLAAKDYALEEKSNAWEEENTLLAKQHKQQLHQRDIYIKILEERLRLATIQKFAAKSEKIDCQIDLFDEAELEVTLAELEAQLTAAGALPPKPSKAQPKNRERQFPEHLPRVRIELPLSEAEKASAKRTFFSKVKEELDYIPAKLQVLEYWQEKAVFDCDEADQNSAEQSTDNSSPTVISAPRPVHPLGKCFASIGLLAYLITAKYADGLPLYRLEGILNRAGHSPSRSAMAHWMVQLSLSLRPLINLLRESQNSGDYINADETRTLVLKENGKRAQSNKWMWVTCGGPPDQPSVLFEYDPTRAGAVPERLLDGFAGLLQVDGYAGYAKLCEQNRIQRLGCWDHCRRKFVEAAKAADVGKKAKKVAKADMALSFIRKLYRIEATLKDADPNAKYQARQAHSVPILNQFKAWLETNIGRVLKGSLTYKAMKYALNQWDYLMGYCDHGIASISNARAENAIRPFAVGRKAWLFSDTPQGAQASATLYSLIETAKGNGLDPYRYIYHLLENIGAATTLEDIEALLPWNVPERIAAAKKK